MYLFVPEFVSDIFLAYEQEGKVLNIFYQLGLIFLMFLSGYNTKLDIDKKNSRMIGCIFVGATFLPMIGALPFISLFQKQYIGELGNNISFGLVFTIGVAITSIPVISKIFFDMGVMNTKFSDTVLTVSTFQDLCLWILLNAATRIASTGEVRLIEMLVVVSITLGLFGVVKIVSERATVWKTELKPLDFYSVSFVVLLFVSALLYKIGINIMYSAFLVGYIVKAFVGVDEKTKGRMESLGNIAFSFFVPISFK